MLSKTAQFKKNKTISFRAEERLSEAIQFMLWTMVESEKSYPLISSEYILGNWQNTGKYFEN